MTLKKDGRLISIVAAVNVHDMPLRNTSLWHCRNADLSQMLLTQDIVIGARTFERLFSTTQLPCMHFIVLSRHDSDGGRHGNLRKKEPRTYDIVRSPEGALQKCMRRRLRQENAPCELFVCGGLHTYSIFLPHADRVYLLRGKTLVRLPDEEASAWIQRMSKLSARQATQKRRRMQVLEPT